MCHVSSSDKQFYETHHDRIADKRYHSRYPIRRAVHRDIYDSVLEWVPKHAQTLDAGCGEGVLSCLMATERGAHVSAIDYSRPNIDAARQRALSLGSPSETIHFEVGDAESLPFGDETFDCVVSNHVLEHIPNFELGIRELHRVTRDLAIVAVPTCLNPCSWALLGGAPYWRITKRTPYAIPLGAARVVKAWLAGEIGVDEGYAGGNTHIHRFPTHVHDSLLAAGFVIEAYAAQSIRVPYVGINLTQLRTLPGFRSLGLGTVYKLRKR